MLPAVWISWFLSGLEIGIFHYLLEGTDSLTQESTDLGWLRIKNESVMPYSVKFYFFFTYRIRSKQEYRICILYFLCQETISLPFFLCFSFLRAHLWCWPVCSLRSPFLSEFEVLEEQVHLKVLSFPGLLNWVCCALWCLQVLSKLQSKIQVQELQEGWQ